MRAVTSKNWEVVLEYANSIHEGRKLACIEIRQCVDRFLKDLERTDIEIRHEGPEFCIQIIEKTLCHQQGESIDGKAMRGKPFRLQPFQKFIIYNLIGFYYTGTDTVRYTEAMIFLPRKNVKTTFAAALAYALSLWYRRSGSKCYIASAALLQSMESFNFLKYNIDKMGENQRKGGHFKIMDNSFEHSISGQIGDGSIYIRALAASPDKQDSLNANLCICDEIHAFRQPKQYNLFKECQQAYTNKLLIGISTAGDDAQGFLAQRLKYCRSILDGTVEDDAYFIFIACANPDENGDIDYTDPKVHEMANPSYGVTIRPEEILNNSRQAQNDPQQRKDFLAKNLNVFTAAMRAWFDIEELRRSDLQYNWTMEQLAKLPINWYGGADLSRLYDLTAACIYGTYEGKDICITHGFFPITEAARKADEDGIPLFGWKDDGLLTLCNSPTVNHSDVVNWFIEMRKKGFRIKLVGHDRKFAGEEYFPAMTAAGFKVVDQPQYFYIKSQGFRHIEKKIKDGEFYYLHSQAYEYCVQNVRAVEKTDDAVQYEKIEKQRRIDLFDASVFACITMINDDARSKKARNWWGE